MGELRAQAFLVSDEFVNRTGVSQRVVARFLIDGGSLSFLDAGNAEISYQVAVSGENLGTVGPQLPPVLIPPRTGLGAPLFLTEGDLVSDAVGGISFATRGEDIGATQLGPRDVEIPLSLQTLDLGVLGPGDRLLIEYLATFRLALSGPFAFFEGGSFQFSDPLALGLEPVLEVVMMPVPEPAGILFVGAFSGIAAIAARRTRRAAGPIGPRIARRAAISSVAARKETLA